jgi:hypothetical protein
MLEGEAMIDAEAIAEIRETLKTGGCSGWGLKVHHLLDAYDEMQDRLNFAAAQLERVSRACGRAEMERDMLLAAQANAAIEKEKPE